MRVPASFTVFQLLAEESTKNSGSYQVNKEESKLSKFCDYVLSTLHSHELFRDSIIDSRPNLGNDSLLLMVNPELRDVSELLDFIRSIPKVGKVGFGKKRTAKGDIQAIKLISK
jgi:hypothetical protein